MRIVGIDAAHRAIGVAALEVFDGKIIDLEAAFTLTTKPLDDTIAELNALRRNVEIINETKQLRSITCSACEIAHFGRSFESSRSVGLTWGIAIATNSHAYTAAQVRQMWPTKKGIPAKATAKAWLIANNFNLTQLINKLDHHQIDAVCVALRHYHTTHERLI